MNSEYSRSKKKILDLVEEFQSKGADLKVFSLPDFPYSEYSNQSKFVFAFPYFSRNYANELFSFNESLKEKPTINKNTISHFARTWFRNYFVNLDLSSSRGNTGFVFADSFPFKEKDILFVGAAPILEEQISWIKLNQDRVFILSSDTACYTLLANGIRPDYILSIDAGRGTIFHFRNIPIDIPIITWLGANSHIFHLPNPIYLYMSSYPLDQVLHSILFSDRESLFQNPSLNVAGLSKAIAENFSASRLILSGVSFKMQFGKTHARGTGYESFNLPRVNRFYSMEAYSPRAYQKEISGKNKSALYHLMESNRIEIIKPEKLAEIRTGTAIYKTKPLSLKVSENYVEKFKKLVYNQSIQRQILSEAGINKIFYDRVVQRLI